MSSASTLVSGFLAAGYLVIALFFLRFWRQAADRLFAFFAAAFVLLAFQRLLLTTTAGNEEFALYLYAIRAFSFLLILYAIVDKNRA